MKADTDIEIKLCQTVEILEGCVELQRRVFDMPEIELSPVRHFIVTMYAGGFTLGAFHLDRMIGFCLSVPAFLDGEKAFYSHMTAVDNEFQCHGIGALLKWRQREQAIRLGAKTVKWTFQPEKALNAYFNLEKLGAEVREYMPNFYGTEYGTQTGSGAVAIHNDRLFAVWNLESTKVISLSEGEEPRRSHKPVGFVETVSDWTRLLKDDREKASAEQMRIRSEFEDQFAKGRVCRGFRKNILHPAYEFFEK